MLDAASSFSSTFKNLFLRALTPIKLKWQVLVKIMFWV